MKLTYILYFFFITIIASAQHQQFTIDHQTYETQTLVDGELSLYTGHSSSQRHYIMAYEGDHVVLKKENYREQIKKLLNRSLALSDVKYKTRPLVMFTDEFNHREDEGVSQLNLGLSIYGGLSNQFLFPNPDNEKYGVVGAELEFSNRQLARRHSLFIQFNQTINTSDYKFNLSQLSLNYRFRFLDFKSFYAAVNIEFFDLNYVSFEDSFYNQDGEQILKDEKSTSLDTPISLGASLNFKISKVTTIFVSYNDFVALGVSDNGETSLDFNLGLRFNL